MRLVFAGTPDTAVPALRTLATRGHDIAAVITRPDAAVGRHRKLVPSPVAQVGAELGIPVLKPVKPCDPSFVQQLIDLAPELCPVVAYGALIPTNVLAIPVFGWINLHFSLLPRWRGAAPVQRALMAGDSTVGATTFRLVSELDAGPVYRTLAEAVAPTDTAGTVLDRLANLGADLLADTIDDIAAGRQPTQQPSEGITVAAKITVADARLDWARSAAELANLIAGTSPHPGAWTTFEGQHFKVLQAHPAGSACLRPGQLSAGSAILMVGTGAGDLELIRVQGFGKKAMPGPDWARGAKLDASAHLG